MSDTDEFVQQISLVYRNLPPGPAADPNRAREVAQRRRQKRFGSAIGAVILCVAGGIAFASLNSGSQGPLPVKPVGSALSSESRLSGSAGDWARSSDVVVVGKVISEEQTGEAAAADGSDDAFVSRSVTIAVIDDLWSPSGVKAPGRVSVQAPGWVSSGGKLIARLSIGDSPRLEVGHTYILALLKDRCGLPWQLLGSDGALPYDSGKVGTGEAGGGVTTYADQQRTGSELSKQVAGRDAAAVRVALSEARAGQPGPTTAPTC